MHPHTLFLADKTLTILVQWCVAAGFCAAELVIAAVIDQKANATLTEAEPLRQRSGRCGRRCTCRRTAGKGFQVQEVCVQGRVFAVTANVASQSRLQRCRPQLVVQRALRLL